MFSVRVKRMAGVLFGNTSRAWLSVYVYLDLFIQAYYQSTFNLMCILPFR